MVNKGYLEYDTPVGIVRAKLTKVREKKGKRGRGERRLKGSRPCNLR